MFIRKHIGAKIGILVTLLTVFFLLEAIVGGLVRQNMSGAVEQMSAVYAQLEGKNTALTRKVGDCKSNANMLVWMKIESACEMFANETIPQDIEIINSTLGEMELLCEQTGEADLIQAFATYRDAVGNITARAKNVADAYKTGDMEATAAANNGMQADVNLIDETEAVFNETLTNIIKSTSKTVLVESAFADTMVNVLCAIYLLVTAIAVFVIIKLIAGPVSRASTKLADIVDKIEKNE